MELLNKIINVLDRVNSFKNSVKKKINADSRGLSFSLNKEAFVITMKSKHFIYFKYIF